MKLLASDLAHQLSGTYRGPDSLTLTGAAGLKEATESDISFLKDIKNKNTTEFLESKAGVILVPVGIEATKQAVIEVINPLLSFASVLKILEQEKRKDFVGIHSTSYIHPSAKIGKNVSIGPFCVVEEEAVVEDNVILMAHVYVGQRSLIKNHSRLYPHVVIREDVIIGARCILHSGAIIGSDGYGFTFVNGQHHKIPQIGTVCIEDDVEIGSCTTVDRAMTGKTMIKKGSKIDNLVQIAHNVEIGELTLLAAQVGIAGSSKLGKGVVLGGQSGVGDHICVADGTKAGGQTGINKNTSAGDVLFGTPAQPLTDALKMHLYQKRLSELFKDVKKIKEKLNCHD